MARSIKRRSSDYPKTGDGTPVVLHISPRRLRELLENGVGTCDSCLHQNTLVLTREDDGKEQLMCKRCGWKVPERKHTRATDIVDHPDHYGGADNPYEAIKVIDAWGLGFSLGNALKYIARAGKKAGVSDVEDLKKAHWYIEHEIKRREGVKAANDQVR